jgi:hypothetical protein
MTTARVEDARLRSETGYAARAIVLKQLAQEVPQAVDDLAMMLDQQREKWASTVDEWLARWNLDADWIRRVALETLDLWSRSDRARLRKT